MERLLLMFTTLVPLGCQTCPVAVNEAHREGRLLGRSEAEKDCLGDVAVVQGELIRCKREVLRCEENRR